MRQQQPSLASRYLRKVEQELGGRRADIVEELRSLFDEEVHSAAERGDDPEGAAATLAARLGPPDELARRLSTKPFIPSAIVAVAAMFVCLHALILTSRMFATPQPFGEAAVLRLVGTFLGNSLISVGITLGLWRVAERLRSRRQGRWEPLRSGGALDSLGWSRPNGLVIALLGILGAGILYWASVQGAPLAGANLTRASLLGSGVLPLMWTVIIGWVAFGVFATRNRDSGSGVVSGLMAVLVVASALAGAFVWFVARGSFPAGFREMIEVVLFLAISGLAGRAVVQLFRLSAGSTATTVGQPHGR